MVSTEGPEKGPILLALVVEQLCRPTHTAQGKVVRACVCVGGCGCGCGCGCGWVCVWGGVQQGYEISHLPNCMPTERMAPYHLYSSHNGPKLGGFAKLQPLYGHSSPWNSLADKSHSPTFRRTHQNISGTRQGQILYCTEGRKRQWR